MIKYVDHYDIEKRRLERPPISSPFSAPHVTSKTACLSKTALIMRCSKLQ